MNIPPEVKHWHGAALDCWCAHLVVEVPAEGASNEWLEAVSDEDYGIKGTQKSYTRFIFSKAILQFILFLRILGN